jgi:phosphate transport system protein
MSTVQSQSGEAEKLLEMTLQGCHEAQEGAHAACQAVTEGSPEFLARVRRSEEELDTLDRRMNEEVTRVVFEGAGGSEARELLACLKCVLELERIGDLLLSFANRAQVVFGRLDGEDARELATMAGLVEKMLQDGETALRSKDVNLVLTILRTDGEVDRLRNLLFMRHIENREQQPLQESFHVVFMAQALERAGDHAKNFAEEVVHLATGSSVRHLMRARDKPDEVRFLEWMRQRENRR